MVNVTITVNVTKITLNVRVTVNVTKCDKMLHYRSPVRRAGSRSGAVVRPINSMEIEDNGASEASEGGDKTKVRLIVSNIPFQTSWQDLKDLYKDKGRLLVSSSLVLHFTQCFVMVDTRYGRPVSQMKRSEIETRYYWVYLQLLVSLFYLNYRYPVLPTLVLSINFHSLYCT